jgi:cytochrome c-type biogenesis protein CcmH/NrfF
VRSLHRLAVGLPRISLGASRKVVPWAPSRGRTGLGVMLLAGCLMMGFALLQPLAAAEQAGQAPPGPGSQPPPQTVIPDPDQFEASAPTDDAQLEAQVQRLARQLRCPTCQALSIADSPSELAREMEGVIRLRLQEGMTPEEVRQSFVNAYGEWVLLSPEPAGFNLLVYILPVAVFLLGGGIVVVGMRKWLRNPSEGPLEVERAPPAP